MNIKLIIKQWVYEDAAQESWPSYQELLDGKPAKTPDAQQEVDNFVNASYREYYTNDRGNTIADTNRIWQSQIFFDKKAKITRCNVPWETLGVNAYGDVFICQSPTWVPKFAGNIHCVENIYDILNSDTALKIRQEIVAGRYYYCNSQLCAWFGRFKETSSQQIPTSDSDLLPLDFSVTDELLVKQIPKFLIFDFDMTCNFKCPSCRTEVINNNKHRIIRPIADQISGKIKSMIIDKIEDQPIIIRWAGGEPFISDVYFDLLEYIIKTGKNNIKHIIQTNGSYLKSKQELVKYLLPNMEELRISFDAATADTYHKIRVNGVWENLLTNVQWVINEIKQNNLSVKVTADFVVQRDNYKEIPLFKTLCDELGIKHINYQKMWDWASWSKEEFNQHNVYTREHPEYNNVINLLKQVNK